MNELEKRVKKMIGKNIVINIKTMDELDEFMKIYKNIGVVPFRNVPRKHFINNGDFCVRAVNYSGMLIAVWETISYYRHKGYKVVEFKDLVNRETIVIYRENNSVIALDKISGKRAVAKCSPDDKFDFNIGAKLAFKRLTSAGIGDTVVVNDVHKTYNRYDRWAGLAGFEENFKCGALPKNNKKYKVGLVAKHNGNVPRYQCDLLALIQDIYTAQVYIVNTEALTVVHE